MQYTLYIPTRKKPLDKSLPMCHTLSVKKIFRFGKNRLTRVGLHGILVLSRKFPIRKKSLDKSRPIWHTLSDSRKNRLTRVGLHDILVLSRKFPIRKKPLDKKLPMWHTRLVKKISDSLDKKLLSQEKFSDSEKNRLTRVGQYGILASFENKNAARQKTRCAPRAHES